MRTRAPESGSMTILIADTTRADSIVLRNILERVGHSTLVVDNGMDALEFLELRPEIELVVAEVGMPDLDGLELFQIMRERPALWNTPVVLVGHMDDAAAGQEMLPLGLAGLLLKPLHDAARILDCLERALTRMVPILAPPDSLLADPVALRWSRQLLLHGVSSALRASGPPDERELVSLRAAAEGAGAQRLVLAIDELNARQNGAGHLAREMKAACNALTLSSG